MPKYGPMLPQEVIAAGLAQLPVTYGTDFISGRENLTAAQNAALQAVIDAHDPNRKPPDLPTIEQLIDVLTPQEGRTVAGADAVRDVWRLIMRSNDGIPPGNAKVKRLATAMGTTPDEWFARVPAKVLAANRRAAIPPPPPPIPQTAKRFTAKKR